MQLDEYLNLQNLTNAIGDKWEDFEAFILHLSIKRTHKRVREASLREELFKNYGVNDFKELNLSSLKEGFDSFQQMLRIKKKSGMNEEDSKLYEWKYKPLENMPDELASAINFDITRSEGVLKESLWKSVTQIEKYFILSPYTNKGSEFRVFRYKVFPSVKTKV